MAWTWLGPNELLAGAKSAAVWWGASVKNVARSSLRPELKDPALAERRPLNGAETVSRPHVRVEPSINVTAMARCPCQEGRR